MLNFSTEMTYPWKLADVLSMLTDPNFATVRGKTGGIEVDPAIVSMQDSLCQINTELVIPADVLPEKYRGVLGNGIKATLVETWPKLNSTDQICEGKISLSVASMPVRIRAVCVLIAEGDSTRRTMDGKIQVQIPFMGNQIEKRIVSHLPELSEQELQSAKLYWS